MRAKAGDREAPYQAHNLRGQVRTLFNWAIARGASMGSTSRSCDRLTSGYQPGSKKLVSSIPTREFEQALIRRKILQVIYGLRPRESWFAFTLPPP
jgi:hypothetical protein